MSEIYNFKDNIWRDSYQLPSKNFDCWNCNNKVASDIGYGDHGNSAKRIYLCPHCSAPNLFDHNGKSPLSTLPGEKIDKLPANIESVYSEIRKCMQSNCFTAAIMLMRKIVMNIAVHEGAKENLKFIEYIDYLCDNNIVPKKSKSKAESVKDLGNSANHEIENRTQEEAKNCFEFIDLLLKVNYAFADEGLNK